MMAQHFVDMDQYRHNESLLVTDGIDTCLGICVIYDDGVFLLHASPAYGIPTSNKTTTKENVQRVNFHI